MREDRGGAIDKAGCHILIIVEAEFWVHGSSLYFSLYFYVCFKFSVKWRKKKSFLAVL